MRRAWAPESTDAPRMVNAATGIAITQRNRCFHSAHVAAAKLVIWVADAAELWKGFACVSRIGRAGIMAQLDAPPAVDARRQEALLVQ